MKTRNMLLVILVLFVISCTQTKTPKFDHYGVYLKTEEGFVELKKNLQTNLPKVEIADELVIYVFSPQAKEMQCDLYEGRSRSIENKTAPVGDHPEMIKISAPAGDVFGGLISFYDKGNDRYFFEVVNEDTKKSLIRWMEKNLSLIEEEDYEGLIMNNRSVNDFQKIGSKDMESILQSIKDNADEIEEFKAQMKEHTKMIKNDEKVEMKYNSTTICVGQFCYEFLGNGKWRAM